MNEKMVEQKCDCLLVMVNEMMVNSDGRKSSINNLIKQCLKEHEFWLRDYNGDKSSQHYKKQRDKTTFQILDDHGVLFNYCPYCAQEISWDQIIVEFAAQSIPKGDYCYGENGICPFYSSNLEHDTQENGYCSLLNEGDWHKGSSGLLWDQCKSCQVNLDA